MFCGDKNHLDFFKCNDVRQYHSSHSINSQFVVNLNNGVRQSADHLKIGIYVSYPWLVWITVYYVSYNTSEFVKVRDTYVQSWHGFTPKTSPRNKSIGSHIRGKCADQYICTYIIYMSVYLCDAFQILTFYCAVGSIWLKLLFGHYFWNVYIPEFNHLHFLVSLTAQKKLFGVCLALKIGNIAEAQWLKNGIYYKQFVCCS